MILLFSCNTPVSQTNIEDHIKAYYKKNDLDKRTSYIEVNEAGGKITCATLSEELKNGFLAYIEEEGVAIDIDFETIAPKQAYIRNSVSNARSQPKHSAELSTQYLMGQKIDIIKQDGDWYYIQGPDHYLSWIDAGGILLEEEVNKDWLMGEKYKVLQNEVEAKGLNDSYMLKPVSDLVFGNIISETNNHTLVKGYSTYLLPDGTPVYLDNSVVQAVSNLESNSQIEKVIEKANSLMGRPYLWGGTSTKGMDCSGFTRTAFMNADYLLGRDASLQVKEGVAVDVEDRSTWERGDLLFFGTVRDDGSHRITHVAIHLGDGDMIHASQRIRVESINPDRPLYNRDRDESLLQVRRIF